MTEDRLGSGMKLTSDWDLEIDGTGDIATISGQKEIEKDLAMLLAIQLEDKLGGVIDPTQTAGSLKQIELLVERVLLADGRVPSVQSVSAEITEGEQDSVSIEAEVTADNGEDYDLIVEVDN